RRWRQDVGHIHLLLVSRDHMLHQQLLFGFHRGLLFLRRHSLPYVGKEFSVATRLPLMNMPKLPESHTLLPPPLLSFCWARAKPAKHIQRTIDNAIKPNLRT